MAVKNHDFRNDLNRRRERLDADEQRVLNQRARATLGSDLTSEDIEFIQGQDALEAEETVGWVPIEDVHPMGTGISEKGRNLRSQPRKFFDSERLEALTFQIQQEGQQTPAEVRVIGIREGRPQYGIIKGERRYWASKAAGKTRFFIRLKKADDRAAFRMAIIDDAHNVNHTPAERGSSIAQMQLDLSEELSDFMISHSISNEKPMSQERFDKMEGFLLNREETPYWICRIFERCAKTGRRPKVQIDDLAVMIGLSDKSVRNYLLNAGLTPEILDKALELKLTIRHILALSSLKQKDLQEKLLREIEKKSLNGEDSQERAAEMKAEHDATPRPAKAPLRPLRSLVAQTRKFAAIEVPKDTPEEAKEEGRALLDEWEKLLPELRKKWG